jgi:hypothetical protein
MGIKGFIGRTMAALFRRDLAVLASKSRLADRVRAVARSQLKKVFTISLLSTLAELGLEPGARAAHYCQCPVRSPGDSAAVECAGNVGGSGIGEGGDSA